MPDISNQLSSEIKEIKDSLHETAEIMRDLASTLRDTQAEAADALSKKKKNNDESEKVDDEEVENKKKYQDEYEKFTKKDRAERRKALRETIKQNKEEKKQLEIRLANGRIHEKLDKKEIKYLQTKINNLKEETKLKESYLKELDSFTKAVEGISSQIAEFQSGTLGKLFSGFFGKLTAVLGGATLGAAVLNVLNQSDKAFVNIAKAAGTSVSASGQMRKQFIAASGALQQMGIDTEQQAAIVSDVINTYGKLAYVTQENLEITGSLMSGLGMSSEEAVGTLKILTKTLGMSAANAQDFANTMKNDAVNAGISASLVFRDVTSYSEQTNAALLMAPERLKQAAIRARQLGTSLSESASAAENFQDLESSLGLSQEAAVLFGAKFDAMEMTRLARAGDTEGLQNKVLQSLKSQINAKGELVTTDIDQIKFLERVLGKDYPAIIKSFTLQNKLKGLGVEAAEEQAAVEQLILEKGTSLAEVNAQYLKDNKEAIKDKMTSLAAEQDLRDLATQNQATLEKIGNTFKSAIVPLTNNVVDAFIDIFGSGQGIDEALVGFKNTLEGIMPSKDTLVEGFKTIKSVVTTISNMLKWVFENPKLSIIAGLATMLVGGAVKKKIGLGKADGTERNPLYVKMADAASGLLDSLSSFGADAVTTTSKEGPSTPKSLPKVPKGKGGAIVGSVLGLLRGAGPKMLTGLKEIFSGAIGKGFLKKIPLLGLLFSMYDMIDRFKKGDYLGAAIEFVAAVASLFPGIGTGIGIALSGVNVARDMAGGGKNAVADGLEAAKNGAAGLETPTKPSTAPPPPPAAGTPSKPTSKSRGGRRRRGGGASMGANIPNSVSEVNVEGMSAEELAAQYGVDISGGGYGFSEEAIKKMSPQKIKDYLQKNNIDQLDKMSAWQKLKMYTSAKSGDFDVEKLAKGKADKVGAAPRKPNPMGEIFNEPTLLVAEERPGEMYLPMERWMTGKPVAKEVERGMEKMGYRRAFGGLGPVGVSGGAVGTGLGAKSDLGASLGGAQAATALATSAGDLTASERRLSASIKDTTDAQLEQQNVQDQLNKDRLDDQKKFSWGFLEAVGRHMESAETFINNNEALMNEMGSVGDFLQNNSKLIGDVGRFLQAKDKKEAAITLALDTLQNKIESSFGEKGVIANEIISGLRNGMKPSQAAMQGLGNFLLGDRKAREQKQKDYLMAQEKQQNLEEYFRQQGLTDQAEIQARVSEELDANTQAILNQGDPSKGGGPGTNTLMKEAVGDFALGVQGLMASGKSFKDAAKTQLKAMIQQKLIEKGMWALFNAEKILFAIKQAWEIRKMSTEAASEALENAGPLTKFFSSLLGIIPALIGALASAAAAIWGALITGLSALFGALMAVAGAIWGALFPAFVALLAGVWSVVAAFFMTIITVIAGLIPTLIALIVSMGPFALIGLAVLALIAVIMILVKFFPQIKKALTAVFKFVGKIVVKIVGALFKMVKALVWSIPKAIIKGALKIIKAVGGIFGKVGGAMVKGIKNLLGKLNPLNWFSEGGVVTKPTMSMVGETGEKEVIVPVDRIKSGGKVKPEVMSELRSIAPNIVGSGGGGGAGGDAGGGGNDALINEIKMLRQEIAAISNRPIAVTLDGRQVAKSVGERFTDMSNNI